VHTFDFLEVVDLEVRLVEEHPILRLPFLQRTQLQLSISPNNKENEEEITEKNTANNMQSRKKKRITQIDLN
jgi:hypothetical protein